MRNLFLVLLLGICLFWLSACNLGAGVAVNTPVPTPDRPEVRFQFPENGALIYEGAEVVMDIVASDNNGGVARLEVYVDNVLVSEGTPPEADAVAVFRVNTEWMAEGLGLHTLSAIAYRTTGQRSDEAIVAVEVVARED